MLIPPAAFRESGGAEGGGTLCFERPSVSGRVAFRAAEVAELTPGNAAIRTPAMAAAAKLAEEFSENAKHEIPQRNKREVIDWNRFRTNARIHNHSSPRSNDE